MLTKTYPVWISWEWILQYLQISKADSKTPVELLIHPAILCMNIRKLLLFTSAWDDPTRCSRAAWLVARGGVDTIEITVGAAIATAVTSSLTCSSRSEECEELGPKQLLRSTLEPDVSVGYNMKHHEALILSKVHKLPIEKHHSASIRMLRVTIWTTQWTTKCRR